MKILKWIGALVGFLFAVKLSTDARRHQQRAEDLTNKEIEELSKGKQANLDKAKKLGETAEAAMKRAADAQAAAEARATELENNDETDLASRIRDFNGRL